LLGGLFAVLLACAAAAEPLPTGATRDILTKLDDALNGYVDPAVGVRVKEMLKRNRSKYARITDADALAETLSRDLVVASGDQHLKISRMTSAPGQDRLSAEQEALLEARLAHGLMAIRRLPGNIGYLKLRYFADDAEGASLIDAAIGMLQDTDALILDLRENTGGGGASDERLLGHLSRAPIPMAAIRWRQPDGSVTFDQRRPSVPATGPAYPDKPLFVLTTRRTFSAAEEVALDLKAAGRAVLVGEATRGGANPGYVRALAHGFGAFIPTGTVTHPLTSRNWNSGGVTPDVKVAAGEALTEAYRRALALAKPTVSTPKSEQERAAAIVDPRGTLLADQAL